MSQPMANPKESNFTISTECYNFNQISQLPPNSKQQSSQFRPIVYKLKYIIVGQIYFENV